MQINELQEWVSYHDSLFPDFAKWFRSADTAEQLDVRNSAWHGRLSRFRLDQVKKQSLAMFESRDKPKFNGDHLDWIMGRLNPRPQLNSSFAQGFRGQICQQCNGTGIVSVVFFEQRLTVGGRPLPNNRGPAACRCAAGKHMNDRRKDHPECDPLPVFHSDSMAADIPERPTRDELAQCRERLMVHHPKWMLILSSIERRIERRQREVAG